MEILLSMFLCSTRNTLILMNLPTPMQQGAVCEASRWFVW